MRFISLTVENLGVFRGRYEFDLTPFLPVDDHRNAIVFTGHNGAGKTMLFTALQLALHGPLALGDRVTRDEYSDYLFHRLHRYYEEGQTVVSEHGSAGVRIEYSRSGQISAVDICRKWVRRGNSVHETLEIAVDGQAPDVVPEDAQSWINDYSAPSLLPVCFLDAEQLSMMSDPQEYEKLLARNLKRLLGLDLVERLDADLGQYVRGESRGSDADVLEGQFKHLELEKSRLMTHLASLREQESALAQKAGDLLGEIVAAERALAAEGGAFAARREQTQIQAEELRGKISTVEKQLAEAANELLPFALAPDLLRRMIKRLRDEALARHGKAAAEAVTEWAREVAASVEQPKFWNGLRVSDGLRDRISTRISEVLRPITIQETPSGPFIHDVGESSRQKLIAWNEEITGRYVHIATDAARQLRDLKRELRLAESGLASAPSDELLRPLHARIAELQKELAETARARSAVQVEVGAAEFRCHEKERAVANIRDELEQLSRNDTRMELARRSRLALRAYQDAALRQGLRQFEREFVEEFNLLCRKEDLLSAVFVDPETFKMRFEAAAGHVLRLANFSAGERQLAALSSLWALRIIAKRSLPLAIDTPLGRLDAVHRESVLTDFLPIVADQVLLFATDAEIDLTKDDTFGLTVARAYHLTFDPDRQLTVVNTEERTDSGGLHAARAAASMPA
ncbi:MAG TPA: DNA sulfur modification protein DndD [Thermoanaerobaculia bacterium]|jgi:DNA sulfur modification protein DndD|nr:DNA sulfur modification protein DndD [Thermoanaerobaculia bacterium]